MLGRKLFQTASCRWGTPGPGVVESFRGDGKEVQSGRVPCASLSLHAGQLSEEIRWEEKRSLTYGTDVRRTSTF